MKNCIQIFGLFVLLSLATQADAERPDFKWEPGTVSAKVKVDKFRPEMGQYLSIAHDGSGEENWNMAKLNLPESWTIKSVAVDGLIINITTENAGKFTITQENLKIFWYALLKEKMPTDERLAEIWRAHALAKK